MTKNGISREDAGSRLEVGYQIEFSSSYNFSRFYFEN